MPATLLDWLTRNYPTAKRQTLKRMVQAGRVSIGDRVAKRLNEPIDAADQIAVADRPRAGASSVHPLTIVHEDADILVIEKPPGLLTSTTPREPRATALAVVKRYLADREPRAKVGLIHRLDRDAAGLLIFSKTEVAYDSLKTQFFKHTVDRVYAATVHGKPKPPKARIESRLLERADGTVYSTKKHAAGQRAITDYEVVRSEKNRSELRVKLLTGRKHQIRVHLSERGWPIVGDRVYGRKDDPVTSLHLKAIELAVTHPRTGERMLFTLPAD